MNSEIISRVIKTLDREVEKLDSTDYREVLESLESEITSRIDCLNEEE